MSTKKCFVVLEVSQKQSYIFATNRLSENIGASIIIRNMTKEAWKDALASFEDAKNKGKYPKELTLPERYISNPEQYCEDVLFNDGGGKSTFHFDSEEEADNFIKITSLHLLRTYPGAEPYYAKLVYSDEGKIADIPELLDKLYKKLNEQKGKRKESFHFIGLGLSKKCPSTSLPVNIIDGKLGHSLGLVEMEKKKSSQGDERYNISTYVKLEAAERQNDEFRKMIFENQKDDLGSSYEELSNIKFPLRFEQLGCSKGEKNMVAVICVDGNKMGNRIRKLSDNFGKLSLSNYRNKTYRDVIRYFSNCIEEVYTKAQQEVIVKIYKQRERLEKVLDYSEIELDMVPIRPLILAGDDVCFVTDARIGLDAARIMLESIERISKEKFCEIDNTYAKYFDGVFTEEGLTASAGIVFCGQKYPFSKAHKLAESLVHNAKGKVPGEKDVSMLDFHVVMGEAESDTKREREKQQTDRSLRGATKPYCIHADISSVTTFSEFETAYRKLTYLTQGNGKENKKIGRSKIKELAYYIQQGNDIVRNFIHCSKDLSSIKEISESYAIYLDAIEMLDLYYTIEEREN